MEIVVALFVAFAIGTFVGRTWGFNGAYKRGWKECEKFSADVLTHMKAD